MLQSEIWDRITLYPSTLKQEPDYYEIFLRNMRKAANYHYNSPLLF